MRRARPDGSLTGIAQAAGLRFSESTISGKQCREGAPGKYDCHGSRTCCADPGIWATSGGHFNPAVTIADASLGDLAWRQVPAYLVAQVTGAFSGVATAQMMPSAPVLRRHIICAAEAVRCSVSSLLPWACFALSGDASGFAAPPCPLRWEHTSRQHTGSPCLLPSRIRR